MDRDDLASRIDHTILGPTTTPADVRRVLDEAREYGMNACAPPCYVEMGADHAPDVTLATVVGFPHGQHAVDVKRTESKRAYQAGADELDLVPNLGSLKSGELDKVRSEIGSIVDAVPLPVKVIIETALLEPEEKRVICEAADAAGADFVKTSTGFAARGATVEDVELMSEYLPVKASGGIGSWAAAKAMFDAGAERIGASSGVAIVEGFDGSE